MTAVAHAGLGLPSLGAIRRRLAGEAAHAAFWLRRELWPLLPGWLRAPLLPEAGRILIDMNAPEAAGRALLSATAGDPVAVRLPPSAYVVCELRVPRFGLAERRAVAALQLDRISPFAAGEARFDARIATVGAADAALRVLVVPEAWLAQVETALSARGLSDVIFDVADDLGAPGPDRLRIRSTDAEQADAQERRRVRRFAVAATVFWVAAWFAGEARQEALADGERNALAALADSAREAARLRDVVSGLRAPAEAAARASETLALDRLQHLTGIVPGDVEVMALALDGAGLRLGGRAADAAALLRQLEASPRLRDARFAAPVQRDPAANADRFEIEASWEQDR